MKTEVAVVLGFVGGVGTTLYLTRNLLKDAVAGRIIVAVEDFMASSVPEKYPKYKPVHATEYSKSKEVIDHKVKPVIISDRTDAVKVLHDLIDTVKDYGSVTIAEYYEAVGMVSNTNDSLYGWTDLSGAVITSCKDGYFINFEHPVKLSF